MKNSNRNLPKAPKQLSAEARSFWRKIVSGWELDDAGLLILQSACECLDRVRQAQDLITREGITVADRFGQVKQHPATLVERDGKAALLRHLKALNLDIEPLNTIGRPPQFGRKDRNAN